ncbi:hypothetical protein [Tenggerimyces flavus]|uniref:Uncharacterized protein n=1 Tax=Tenggerimyces flavus TaxID=1708749 RepID=A0ABV7YCE9_9ACTN|nr:hypothetical protein [Tenggerimyces flavus]MBM7788858.1 hypothetical protein [Tenggerimyces flavus]
MKITEHVWKTVDGRLVPHGHPDAAFLEFPAGTEMGDDRARELGLLVDDAPKSRRPAANKQAAKSEDK